MVEPVSHSAWKTGIRRLDPETTQVSGRIKGAVSHRTESAALSRAMDNVMISSAATSLPDELKAGPPIDNVSVNRIRQAIAENRYPIDLRAITDSLFQSFLEVAR
ncbi:flagellar biosynthesis anti-sigma factor FlgM [Thioclava sp. FR2]|uniref:flagellar biosynthesis anti-sigma factor FlgM n=1 Tax=Thioclava sp. FR2 TaxID=3445780 RepID=UPI003EBF055F